MVRVREIWIENLVLFNKCVQRSGGVMNIKSSYTDTDGDVMVEVHYSALTQEENKIYERERIRK